jgi:hypothetical protein
MSRGTALVDRKIATQSDRGYPLWHKDRLSAIPRKDLGLRAVANTCETRCQLADHPRQREWQVKSRCTRHTDCYFASAESRGNSLAESGRSGDGSQGPGCESVSLWSSQWHQI